MGVETPNYLHHFREHYLNISVDELLTQLNRLDVFSDKMFISEDEYILMENCKKIIPFSLGYRMCYLYGTSLWKVMDRSQIERYTYFKNMITNSNLINSYGNHDERRVLCNLLNFRFLKQVERFELVDFISDYKQMLLADNRKEKAAYTSTITREDLFEIESGNRSISMMEAHTLASYFNTSMLNFVTKERIYNRLGFINSELLDNDVYFHQCVIPHM